MENRDYEGPPGEAGQTAESRVQLISSVYRREAFGGVQRGGAETETADRSGRERWGTIAGRRSSYRLLFFFPFPGWRRPSFKADAYYLVMTSFFFATFEKYKVKNNPSMFCCDPERFSSDVWLGSVTRVSLC